MPSFSEIVAGLKSLAVLLDQSSLLGGDKLFQGFLIPLKAESASFLKQVSTD